MRLFGITLRTVFRLPYRSTEGLVRSILELMGASRGVPDYTTLCLRGRRLQVQMHHIAEQARRTGVEVILDGTGMRLDGCGAWRAKVYGESGRGEWVKIHVALDGERGMGLSVEVTGSEVAVVPEVMAGVKERVRQVIADGGYDWRKVYEALMKHLSLIHISEPTRPY